MKSRRKFLKNAIAGTLGLGTLNASCSKRVKTQSVVSELPVINEADVCVIGGSCTGVFAAVRAARLGMKVIIVEKLNSFGGVATNSMVFFWHSLFDTKFEKKIIAGLTEETMNRLKKRNAVQLIDKQEYAAFCFNSEELKIELDEMVLEHEIQPYFHTLFSEPVLDAKGKLNGIIVDNKDGRGIIKAKAFVDASGDADLCHRLGLESYTDELLLPPTTCAQIENWDFKLVDLIKKHRDEFNIPEGFIWGDKIPRANLTLLAGTRVYDVNCATAAGLTKAEIEGRRQVRAIMDLVRKYAPEQGIALTGLPSHIGIRQTRQIKCLHTLTGEELLNGKQFDDAISYGSYRVDIHHQDKPGITFMYLDGREVYSRPGFPIENRRWKEESSDNATYYQIPLRAITTDKYDNLIMAGRMLDADKIAFSAARVMVNMNQLGEAAGTAASLSIKNDTPVFKLEARLIRETLNKGGSVL